MKYSIALIAAGAGFVLAQLPSDLPACGALCINNMIQIASSQFGCGVGDVACYCQNPDFGYGVRDCSNAVCSPEEAARVVGYGAQYCGGVQPSGDATVTAAPTDASATATPTGGEGGSTATDSAGNPITTPTDAAGSAASSVASAASSVLSSAASAASSLLSSATDSAGSAVSSATGAVESAASSAGDAASSAAESATSTGGAPMHTAAPLLGAAGMAALLFI